jgi:two-component system response regulator FixJ
VVHIIDDDEHARELTADLLRDAMGYRTETYSSGADFLARMSVMAPGCVLVILHTPELNGMRRIGEQGVEFPVIIFNDRGDLRLAVHAMKAGVVGFLEKPYAPADLVRAVEHAFTSSEVQKPDPVLAERARARIDRLSPREQQVLRGLLAGHANKLMAFELSLSIRTVEMYRARVMEKLSAVSVSHAVQLALAAELEPLPSAAPRLARPLSPRQ